MPPKSPQESDKYIVKWAHAWAAAASLAYETLDSISIPNSPATESGQRDAMTMLLVEAARNVVRGAESTFGKESDLVQRFHEAHSELKELRNRFEHYEDYIRGTGIAQREGRKRGGEPLKLDKAGIEITGSSAGGPNGHLVRIVVIERDNNGQPVPVPYEVPARTITAAARQLARDLIDTAGMLDEKHLKRCDICANPHNF